MTNLKEFAERAMISEIHLGMWGRTKQSKPGTYRLNERENSGKSGRAIVELDAGLLKPVVALHQEIRQTHAGMTLCGTAEGMRILPSTQCTAHATVMSEYKSKLDVMVADFISKYDEIVANSRTVLGGLWEPTFYPPLYKVEQRFYFTTDYRPLDCLADSPGWQNWLGACLDSAKEDLAGRITSVLERIVNCVSAKEEGGARLFGSVFKDAADLAVSIPELNVAQCEAIKNIAEALGNLGKRKIEIARESASERREIVEEAKIALKTFTGTMDL